MKQTNFNLRVSNINGNLCGRLVLINCKLVKNMKVDCNSFIIKIRSKHAKLQFKNE